MNYNAIKQELDTVIKDLDSTTRQGEEALASTVSILDSILDNDKSIISLNGELDDGSLTGLRIRQKDCEARLEIVFKYLPGDRKEISSIMIKINESEAWQIYRSHADDLIAKMHEIYNDLIYIERNNKRVNSNKESLGAIRNLLSILKTFN